jgi:hypothetical protein
MREDRSRETEARRQEPTAEISLPETRNTYSQPRLEGVWGTQPSLSGGLGASAPKGSVLEVKKRHPIKKYQSDRHQPPPPHTAPRTDGIR